LAPTEQARPPQKRGEKEKRNTTGSPEAVSLQLDEIRAGTDRGRAQKKKRKRKGKNDFRRR